MLALALPFAMMTLQNPWTPDRVLHEPNLDKYESELIQWFGGEKAVMSGADAKIADLTVAWAIDAPEGASQVRVVGDYGPRWPDQFGAGRFTVKRVASPLNVALRRVGRGNLYVGAAKLVEADAYRWHFSIDGKEVGNSRDLEVYTMPPESKPDPTIPAGKLEPQPKLQSKIFGGTNHDWWLYTPANFDPGIESNLMVFQDGQWAHNYAPVYFDHLIAKHDLPQTIVVFVTPGTFPDGKSDRSREYDSLNDMYVRFLLEELLPPVEAKFKIAKDPMRRCVAGLSSGGICSFTTAWQRPDKFGLVMSWIGSFADIASGPTLREGGHNYPALIRKTGNKPIKVFLQDGANDLDNEHGNWPLSNYQMALALEWRKYDLMTVWGNGFHSDRQGRATMADALRWLFKK